MHLCVPRWRIVCVSLVLITSLPSFCGAQESGTPALPEAGLTPLSTFFFVERTVERFADFFTFNTEKQIHKQQERIDERIAELKEILEQTPLPTKGLSHALLLIQGHLQTIVEILREAHQDGKGSTDASLLTSTAASHIQYRLLQTFQLIAEKTNHIEEKFIEQKAALKQKFLEQKAMAKFSEADDFLEEIHALHSMKDENLLTLHSTEETLTEAFTSAETSLRDFLPEEGRSTNTIESALRERITERWKNLESNFNDFRDTLREREDVVAEFLDAALRLGEEELFQREREEFLAIDGEELFLLAKEKDGWDAVTLIHDILQKESATSTPLSDHLGENYQSFLMMISSLSRRTLTEKQEEVLRLFQRTQELSDLHKEHLGRQIIDIQNLCLNSTPPEEKATCLSTNMYPAQEQFLNLLTQEQATLFQKENRVALLAEEEVFESQTTLADNEETLALLNTDLTQEETIKHWIDLHDQEHEKRVYASDILEARRIQEQENLQKFQKELQDEYLRQRAELRSFWKTYTQNSSHNPLDVPPNAETTSEELTPLPFPIDETEERTENSSSPSSSTPEISVPDDTGEAPSSNENNASSIHIPENTIDHTAEKQEFLQKEAEHEYERKLEEQERIDQRRKPTY